MVDGVGRCDPNVLTDLAAGMEVVCTGTAKMLCRPCVDCGLYTGRYCDHCKAIERIPSEQWAEGQMTPLCSRCDWDSGKCRFCRGVTSCTPPGHGQKPLEEDESQQSGRSNAHATVSSTRTW